MITEQAVKPQSVHGRVFSVEEALAIFGKRIASDEFAETVRHKLGEGTNMKYELSVKKGHVTGYVVALNCVLEVQKKSLGSFLRLE
jgi:hypothetical protein